MKKQYRVEMQVPCYETRVFYIDADNPEDAENMAWEFEGDPDMFTHTDHDYENVKFHISTSL
jgi:hypothetical protein